MKISKLSFFVALALLSVGPIRGWAADAQKKPIGQSPVGSTLKTDQTYQRSTQSVSQDCEKLVSGQVQGTLQPKVDKTNVTTDAFGNTTVTTSSQTVTTSSQQVQGTLQPKVDKTDVTTDAFGNTTVTTSYSQKVCK